MQKYSPQNFRENLMKWVVMSNQPFTEVQNPSFINVMKSLNPTAELPSDKTIKRDIMSTFAVKLELLKAKLTVSLNLIRSKSTSTDFKNRNNNQIKQITSK